MGAKRKILAVLFVIAVAPGTFVRSELPKPGCTSPVLIERLEVAPARSGPLALEAAWVLSSDNDHFGGYSALIAWKPDAFLAAYDAGRLMHLPLPDQVGAQPRLDSFLNFQRADKSHADVESLAFNPGSHQVWAGLEWAQQIIRFGPRLRQQAQIRPEAMKDWGGNSGPESLVRLPDGRFVVIEEQAGGAGLHEALLFPEDPTSGAAPIEFTFKGRADYRPSDAALLPNGKMAVLLRGFRWGFPPRFPALLVIADPADIEAGGLLESRFLARIDEPFPSDNYEGLAVIDERDGSWSLWLISDDDFASYQRTLLLKLSWELGQRKSDGQARQKARR